MKSIRYILTALTLIALVIGLAMPVVASYTDLPASSVETARKSRTDDPPWDPGDESARERTETRAVIFSMSDGLMLARKGDQPWDPGDESGHDRSVRVRHA